MKMRIIGLIIGALCIHFHALAQQNASVAQPTIMSIPFAKKGTSTRYVYENTELVRVAITKVKEGFDNLGVNTIDFRAKLKQMGNNEILEEDQATDMKDELVRMSGADIYVEVEANKNASSTGNSVTLILTAFDAFSGESLANKVATSPKFYSDAYEKLTEKAVESIIEDFLATIQSKFDDIRENGRTVVLTLGIHADAEYDLDSEFGNDGYLLSELLEDYIADNAYKGNYHLQGMTSNKIIFDLVKVPVLDKNGRNFRVSRFAANLRKYLKDLGIQSERDIQGQNIVMTLKPAE